MSPKIHKTSRVPAKDDKNFRTGLVLAPLDRTEKAWSDKLPLGRLEPAVGTADATSGSGWRTAVFCRNFSAGLEIDS